MEDLFQELENFFSAKYKGWDGAQQFEGTGERLRRLVEELCWAPTKVKEELEKCFKAVFPDGYDEMLVSGPTEVWILCPHHLLPCHLSVFIGYIPKGKVLGLSKFSRESTILGKRPIMQEQYSRELAEAVWEGLKPEGVGVHIIGRHGCMLVRGIKQGVDISTSILKGSFKEDPKVREEFYDNVNSRR